METKNKLIYQRILNLNYEQLKLFFDVKTDIELANYVKNYILSRKEQNATEMEIGKIIYMDFNNFLPDTYNDPTYLTCVQNARIKILN